MEDWSLQAIVRGSSGDYARMVEMEMEMDGQDEDLSMGYRHGFDGLGFLDTINGSNDDLEDLYKPFMAPNFALPPQAMIDFQEQTGNNEAAARDGDQKKVQRLDRQSDQSSGSSSAGSGTRVSSSSSTAVAAGYSPKYKRRKNQHKRVVIQVTAEGLSSDLWAWRKYGQKPIKGSPYPRSYYRCSSSKGCLARKQVEQSWKDPGMFILTYTAEHSHSQPTRRNSLAGTVRQKFPSSNSKSTQDIKPKINPNKKPDVDHHHRRHHQQHQHQHQQQQQGLRNQIKEESKEYEKESAIIAVTNNKNTNVVFDEEYGLSEFEFNDDFFSGLEEFDDFISDLGAPSSSSSVCTHKFPLRSCS